MKALIKIIIALIVIVACFNAARAALGDYQFQDAVQSALIFDSRGTDDELVDMVMKIAAEHDVPLAAEDVTIRRLTQDLQIDMSYTTSVVLVPGIFAQDWNFTPSASTRLLTRPRR